MLTKKQIAVLFLLSLCPFLWYSMRPDIIGYDGYHYLNFVCGIEVINGELPLSNLLFSVFPCNILAAKVALFVACFLSVLAFASLGKLFNKEKGWRAGVLAFAAGTFILEFAKFENDQFGYPFLFWGVYFFFRAVQNKEGKTLNQIAALILLAIAGGFWGGGLLFLFILGFATSFLLIKFVALPTFVILANKLINSLVPKLNVAESFPTHGLRFMFIPLLGVINFPKNRELLICGATFLIVGIINPKFLLLSLPFLLVGLVYFYETQPGLMSILEKVAVFLAVFGGVGLWFQPPFEYEHQAIDYAMDINKEVQNDDQLGYLIKWHGGKTKYFAYTNLREDGNGTVISINTLPCHPLRTFEALTVWQCDV